MDALQQTLGGRKVILEVSDPLGRPVDASYVILEDGNQYQISVKQKIVDEDATDLTLRRLEDYYDVADEQSTNTP